MSRSYYRGAAGAILVYDMCSHASFRSLQPFLNDARALASPNLSLVLVGNKLDLAEEQQQAQQQYHDNDDDEYDDDSNVWLPTPSSVGSTSTMATAIHAPPSPSVSAVPSSYATAAGSLRDYPGTGGGGSSTHQRATIAPEGREVSPTEASRWASTAGVSVVTEASALSGEGVDEIFGRLARMILTKIELGDMDPDDPMSGIQYGDGGQWNAAPSDGGSIKSSMTGITVDDAAGGSGGGLRRRHRGKSRSQNWAGLREWEEVFTLSSGRRRGGGCC